MIEKLIEVSHKYRTNRKIYTSDSSKLNVLLKRGRLIACNTSSSVGFGTPIIKLRSAGLWTTRP
jgi:hypothetical protein